MGSRLHPLSDGDPGSSLLQHQHALPGHKSKQPWQTKCLMLPKTPFLFFLNRTFVFVVKLPIKSSHCFISHMVQFIYLFIFFFLLNLHHVLWHISPYNFLQFIIEKFKNNISNCFWSFIYTCGLD